MAPKTINPNDDEQGSEEAESTDDGPKVPPQAERPPNISERRHGVRISKVVACELVLGDVRYACESIDMSPGGVQVVIDRGDAANKLAIGTEFILSLESNAGDLKLPCQIARVCQEEPYTVGIAFMGIKPEQRKTLEDWLYQ